MWWFLLKTIMSSVVGSSFYQWWQGTKMGIWFQKHVDAFMQHIATKYDIEVAKKDKKFRAQFPLIANRLELLEKKVSTLEGKKNLLPSNFSLSAAPWR